jgi:hypothetical protein
LPVLSEDEDRSLSGVEGPCSDTHFIPILDEINARADREAAAVSPEPHLSENQRQSAAKNAGRGWGGRRPGAGAPKGNLNAFKHGRTSRRQAEILEAIARIPGVQQALIDIAKRNNRRRKQAEEGFGVMMTRLLERTAALLLNDNNQGDIQEQNKQDFLDYLNETSAQIRALLEKRSSPRRTTIKRPQPRPGGQP